VHLLTHRSTASKRRGVVVIIIKVVELLLLFLFLLLVLLLVKFVAAVIVVIAAEIRCDIIGFRVPLERWIVLAIVLRDTPDKCYYQTLVWWDKRLSIIVVLL
jgi:hypothetical protein